MATIQNFQKGKLKNAQHFAFIQAFISALEADGFTAVRIVSKLSELRSAFAIEDHYYMQVRASEIVAQRAEADERRDRFYGRLHRLVMAWVGSGREQFDEAATALNRIFKLYKVNVSAQMDEETGALENLITDLSTPQMQAHLATIDGTYLYQHMSEAQNQVKTLRMEQGVEESQKVYGALAAARKACDALYDELCVIINGASSFADDPTAYDTFIRKWNGTIKLYQDMLDRKQGGSGNSGSSGSAGGSGTLTPPADTGGSGSTGGSGTGSGTGSGGSGTGSGGSGGDNEDYGDGME